MDFYYIPGTIPDSVRYNSEKDRQKSQSYSLVEEWRADQKPIKCRVGQLLVNATEKNRAGVKKEKEKRRVEKVGGGKGDYFKDFRGDPRGKVT